MLKLTINRKQDTEAGALPAIEKEFESRSMAQTYIDTLYMVGQIDRDEWSRLFDFLSAWRPEAPAGKTIP